jgi:hypothetical protein
MKKYFFAFAVLFFFVAVSFFAVEAEAATINAPSCSLSHVQGAINSVSTGDTVMVPAGNCSWSSGISISGKKITLVGAGIGKTVISLGGVTAVDIGISGSRVTGFEFNFSSSAGVGIYVNHTGWRVDNCEFDFRNAESKGYGIEYDNRNLYYPDYYLGGLVDNCRFYNARSVINGSAFARTSGAYKYHAAPLDLGGPSAVYFEDNYFYLSPQHGNVIDANRSGSYVLRYNTFVHEATSGYCIEAHSLQSDQERGTKKWEIYRNHITSTRVPFYLRGGTGYVFQNIIDGTGNKKIEFDNVRDSAPVGDAGQCNGASSWDSNESGGWLCRDQPGSGNDVSAWSGTLPLPTQNKVPVYIFGGSSLLVSASANVQASRDYYLESGGRMSVGVLTDRPGTCSAGAGYWATDQGNWNKSGKEGQGVLYKCVSANNWQLYYTPYTYPHPLRGGACAPSCTGKACGDNGCGGSCGSCATGQTCSNYQCASQTKKGDLNNSGHVDVTDLGIFLSNWGATTKPASDLNQDGRVDVTDLGILLSNWG